MKFLATLPVVALLTAESLAIAIPASRSRQERALDADDSDFAALEARHHHHMAGSTSNSGKARAPGFLGFGGKGGKDGKQGGQAAAGGQGATAAGGNKNAGAAGAAGTAGATGAAAGGQGQGKGKGKGGKGAAAAAGAAGVAAGAAGAAGAAAAAGGASNSTGAAGAAAGNSTTGVAGATAAAANGGGANANLQTSLTVDPSQLQSNAAKTGQEAGAEAGQVPSLTSTNNFINFCATQQTSITNGLQTKAGSCNPTPMGRIISTDKLVSSKFTNPVNMQTLKAGQTFTISMAIQNMVTGNFVNPNTNYYAAPCQVDASGQVIGHSHVVVEKMTSLTQSTPTDPNVFAFFKGLNGAAQGGVLTADVTGGLAAGTYRLGSINACANHQPVLGAVAQHGIFDDVVYFNVQ